MSTHDEPRMQDEPPNMAWLLTFADLVSLLITFFVLLYSMKVVDQSRWDQITGSLTGVFAEERAIVVVHPEDFQASPVLTDVPADSLPYLQSILRAEFRRDPILSAMEIEYNSDVDILTLRVPTARLFELGDAVLAIPGQQAMQRLAEKLRHLDNRIQVIGHTDPSPALNPNIPTNWELAMLRAIEVAQLLYKRGVQERTPAISYGDSQFATLPETMNVADKYQYARRVDIVIYGDANEF